MKKCPNCGAACKDDALWCLECGADVGPKNQNASYVPDPVETIEKPAHPAIEVERPAQPGGFCPACGSPVVTGSAFCSKCGSPLAGGAGAAPRVVVVEKKEEERPRRPKPRPIIIPKEEQNVLGIVSFVLTMVGLFGFLFTIWYGIGIFLVFLWPITLILSFIAMFKKPRSFAIAAFIISLFECLGLLVVILFFGAVLSAIFS